MPTYVVHAPAGRLDAVRKADLAREITRVHSHHTGAGNFFAQVMFVDVLPGNWFVGGAPVSGDQIHLSGQVRCGRSPEVKRALLDDLTVAVQSASGFPRRNVWAYLDELPPTHMVEYGHVLPAPGEEAQWLAALPAPDRAFIESVGHGRSPSGK